MAGVRSWIRGSLIGAGAYGKVNLALNRDNGELFAVKSIECSDKAESELKAIENEVQILQSLDSPYVVSCYGSDWSVENGKSMRNVFMEYMPGGSVADLMQKFAGKLDESLVRAYSRSILEGLRYLHSQGVMHGDIKGKNVLVGAKGVKLADFGAAKRIAAPGSGQPLESIKGTPHWMAPEVVMQVERGPASDIWSLGCTIVEMASGKAPWNHLPNAFSAMFHIGCTQDLPPMPDSLSEEGRDFLDKCFQRDAKVRWTAQQLLAHPFITGEFCCPEPADKVPQPESPTSVMDFAGPRGWDTQSRSESDIENSVPILALKRAGALAAPAPAPAPPSSAQKQELEFGLGSFSGEQAEDWWCSSPLTPKEGQWITVRSPKLPGPGSSSSSSSSASPLVDSSFSNFPSALLDFSNIFVGAHPAPEAKHVGEEEAQEVVVEATPAVACSSINVGISSEEDAELVEFPLPAPLEEESHEPHTAWKQAQAPSGSEGCSEKMERSEECSCASSRGSLSEACHSSVKVMTRCHGGPRERVGEAGSVSECVCVSEAGRISKPNRYRCSFLLQRVRVMMVVVFQPVGCTDGQIAGDVVVVFTASAGRCESGPPIYLVLVMALVAAMPDRCPLTFLPNLTVHVSSCALLVTNITLTHSLSRAHTHTVPSTMHTLPAQDHTTNTRRQGSAMCVRESEVEGGGCSVQVQVQVQVLIVLVVGMFEGGCLCVFLCQSGGAPSCTGSHLRPTGKEREEKESNCKLGICAYVRDQREAEAEERAVLRGLQTWSTPKFGATACGPRERHKQSPSAETTGQGSEPKSERRNIPFLFPLSPPPPSPPVMSLLPVMPSLLHLDAMPQHAAHAVCLITSSSPGET